MEGGGLTAAPNAEPAGWQDAGTSLTGLVGLSADRATITTQIVARLEGTRALAGRTWLRGTFVTWLPLSGSSNEDFAAPTLFDGTGLTVGFASPEAPTGQVTLTVLPFGSARVRPTFDWADAWGSRQAVPTFVAAWRSERVSAWAALRVGTDAGGFEESEYRLGGLGGVSWWADHGWSFEARGGALDRGRPPAGVHGPGVRDVALGLTSRIGWRSGSGVAPAWDLVTYRFDPEFYEHLALPADEQGALAAQVTLEGGYATQSLVNPAAPTEATQEPAGFVDLQGRLRVGALRLYATARARTFSMVKFDSPGLPRFVASSMNGTATPELSALIGAEARVAATIVAGLLLRVQQPASVVMDSALLGFGVSSQRTVVAPQPAGLAVLPLGSWVPVKTSATAHVRLDPVRDVSIIGGLDVAYDPLGNVAWEASSTATTRYTSSFTIAGSALAQVRFQ